MLALSLGAGIAVAAEPGSDHPLVGRFEGAMMTRYEAQEFDEYPLIVERVTRYGGLDKNLDATRTLEGRLIRITYESAAEHSTLAVFRAYQEALAANGFETLFECAGDACGGRNFNHASPGARAAYMSFGENYQEQRYVASHLARPEGDVYVAIHTARNTSSGGPNKGRIYTQVDVLEAKAQHSKVVVVEADEMASRIQSDGRVALYGIYFDTGSADIQPASKPTLDEIAKLLAAQPDLKLLIVGHTDDRGGFDYNIDLSRRRAESVVRALTGDYAVAPGRLKPWGVGYTAPAASNASEDGRARNRRVELVAGD